ncbi:MAG: HD domain-containing protein [Bacilli bacterium]
MNFEKMSETKVFRDPINGYVKVDYKIIYDLICSKEFQRLKRIHQLGGTFQVFPTAEHSRFSHSIGAYEIARRIINEVPTINSSLNEEEQLTLLIAALLHDVGHGPFSHAFEMINPIHHEEYTISIIKEDSEINDLLKSVDVDLPFKVISVIKKEHPQRLLNQLISSQVDADRMDYLLRDSYFTGATYGYFDVERVLRVIRAQEGQIVFKESGIPALENFMLGRYHMYKQVYHHSSSLSYEVILLKLFERFFELVDKNYVFKNDYKYILPLKNKSKLSNEEIYNLDESVINFYAKLLAEEEDSILREFADRFTNRKLFAFYEVKTKDEVEYYHQKVKDFGYDDRYYFFSDRPKQIVYKKYGKNDLSNVMILTKDNKVVEISKISSVVKSLSSDRVSEDSDYIVLIPKEIK